MKAEELRQEILDKVAEYFDSFEVLGPKAASKKLPDGTMVSAPLEDMAPFLPRGEFAANMLIPALGEF